MFKWSTVEHLMKRMKKELSEENYQLLEVMFEDLRADNVEAETAYSYLLKAGHFLKFLEERGVKVEEATARHIKAFLTRYRSPGARNYAVVALKRLAEANELEHFMEEVSKIKLARRKRKLPRIASAEAVEKLIEHAKQPYKAVLALLYEGGLRRSEVLSLRYGDVEPWDYGYKVIVRRSKSEPRAVFIIRYQQVLREWLQQHRSKDPGDVLFYTSSGAPMGRSALNMYIRRLAMRLGLDPDALNLHPHAFRHLRATELYKSRKLTEKEMMEYFGWKTREMIDVYALIVQNDVEESIRRIYGLPEPAAPNEQEIRCPRCGALASRQARYCPLCGQPLDQELVLEKVKRVEQARKILDVIKALLQEHPELLAEVLK